jgi:branched-chain amino acid transport system substrate-binding protein
MERAIALSLTYTTWTATMANFSKHFAFLIVSALYALAPLQTNAETKVGILAPLTLDGAAYGNDMKNAFILANELIANNAYKLVVEDEQNTAQTALKAYQKLVGYDGVKYILGPAFNSGLLAIAPIAQQKGTLIVSSCATTGDQSGFGDKIYRILPADQYTVPPLLRIMARDGKRFVVITEEDAYAELIARSLKQENERNGSALTFEFHDVALGMSDYRTLFTKVRQSHPDGFFLNTSGEEGFIRMIRQLREMGIKSPVFTVYFGASAVVRKAVGGMLNGTRYVNLRSNDELAGNPKGRQFLTEFKKRFGEPQSALPVVMSSAEALRLLHEALQSEQSPERYLYKRKMTAEESYIGPYWFDGDGAAAGVEYVTRVVGENGDTDIP